MSIENRDLKAGTKLVARYKGKDHTAEVVKTDEGIRYRLEDGTEFKSPSSAGSAVMGGNACNGWRFWSLATEKSTAAKKARKPRVVKKASGFRRLDDGRFWCEACADAFTAPAGIEPIGCPQGHEPTAAAS